MTKKEIILALHKMKIHTISVEHIEDCRIDTLVDALQYELCCNCVEYPSKNRIKHCLGCSYYIKPEK